MVSSCTMIHRAVKEVEINHMNSPVLSTTQLQLLLLYKVDMLYLMVSCINLLVVWVEQQLTALKQVVQVRLARLLLLPAVKKH